MPLLHPVQVPLKPGVTARRFTKYKVDRVQLEGMGPLAPHIVGYALRNDPHPHSAQLEEGIEELTPAAEA